MPGKLVATGDPDADTYLKYAREIHGLTLALTTATAHMDADNPGAYVTWSPAVTRANPVGYARAHEVAALAPALIEEARKYARFHYRLACDRRAADLADVHVSRLISPPSMDT